MRLPGRTAIQLERGESKSIRQIAKRARRFLPFQFCCCLRKEGRPPRADQARGIISVVNHVSGTFCKGMIWPLISFTLNYFRVSVALCIIFSLHKPYALPA